MSTRVAFLNQFIPIPFTLFLAGLLSKCGQSLKQLRNLFLLPELSLSLNQPVQSGLVPGIAGQRLAALFGCFYVLLDRKSTRLNSSHRCISYAVFCLKETI